MGGGVLLDLFDPEHGRRKLRDPKTGGLLLDSKGRPIFEDDKFNKPGILHSFSDKTFDEDEALWRLRHRSVPDPSIINRAPPEVLANLEKSRANKHAFDKASEFQPMMSRQGWEETIAVRNSDGTAVTASATETIMLPIFTLPADYCAAGRWLKWTVFGRQSTAITTPGTITYKLSYSASGVGSVTVATSGAFAPDPTAAATNLTIMVEWWMWVRTDGTSGTAMGIGRFEWSDYDDASASTIVGNLNMRLAPTSAPATASIDTTVARAVSPTYTSSVGTASMTAHGGYLEALT